MSERKRHSINGSIMKVAGMFGSIQVTNIFCSLLRTKLVAIWIGPVGVGLFGIFNAAVEMIASLWQLGLKPSAVRELARTEPHELPVVVKVVRRMALWLGVAGALFTLVCCRWLSELSFGDTSHWGAFAWLSVTVLLLSVNNAEGAVFQGLKRFRELAWCSMAGIVGGTAVSVPMFYFWGVRSIVPTIIAYTVCTWVALGVYRERVPDPENGVTLRQTLAMSKRLLTFGIYLTVSSVVLNLINYAFMAYLNNVADTATVGYFQAGSTLVNRYMGLVFTALSMEYMPRLASYERSKQRLEVFVSNQIYLTVSCTTALVTLFILFSPLIVRLLYDSRFLVMLPYLVWALAGTVLKAYSWCFGVLVMAKGDGKAFFVTEIASGAVNIAFNIAGYRLWGFAGLGVAFVAWYAFYSAMMWWVYRVRYGMIQRGRVGLFLAACCAMAMGAAWGALNSCYLLAVPLTMLACVWCAVMLKRRVA